MAVVRDIDNSDYLSYLSTVALFCGLSCAILMLRFRGFKASLNLSTGKASGKHYDLAPQVSVVGAYRTSREEYFGNVNYLDSRKKITPSMVKLPPQTQTNTGNIQISKSTGDLTKVQNIPAEVRKSTPNVSVHNAAQESRQTKIQLKEQKKLEKQRLAEQKKREKLEAQEREKQEKLRKEREKQAALQQAKEAKEREKQRKGKGLAPQPQQKTAIKKNTAKNTSNSAEQAVVSTQQSIPPPPPLPPSIPTQPGPQNNKQSVPQNTNHLYKSPVQHPSNTLDSSISRSSGPPPYTDSPEFLPNKTKTNQSTTFRKPTDQSSSWDLISEHRQQMNRTGPTTHSSKPKHMDLQYNVGKLTSYDDNSEA